MEQSTNSEKRFTKKRLKYHLGYSALSIIAIVIILKVMNPSLKMDSYTMGKIFGTFIVYSLVISFLLQIVKLKSDKLIVFIIVIMVLPVITPPKYKQMSAKINKSINIPEDFLWDKTISDIKSSYSQKLFYRNKRLDVSMLVYRDKEKTTAYFFYKNRLFMQLRAWFPNKNLFSKFATLMKKKYGKPVLIGDNKIVWELNETDVVLQAIGLDIFKMYIGKYINKNENHKNIFHEVLTLATEMKKAFQKIKK